MSKLSDLGSLVAEILRDAIENDRGPGHVGHAFDTHGQGHPGVIRYWSNSEEFDEWLATREGELLRVRVGGEVFSFTLQVTQSHNEVGD